ncbi:MAG TPA: hypothetical protein PK156_39775, partial [Polyangium sp.]|nr:hypothetical protein [Polyangium sp.]
MKSLVRRFGAWLMRPLPKQQAHLLGTVLTFFLGALGSFTFVLTDADFSVPVMGALVFTTAFAVSRSDVRRWMRMIAFAMICSAYALWTYESIAFGGELAWTISWPIWLLIFGLVVGVFFTHRPKWKYLEIPPVLPMGVVVVASLLGWKSEEGRVRCEDWRAVTEQTGVRIIVPTVPHTCAGDDRIPVARFPRHIAETADGSAYVITTQLRNRSMDNRKDESQQFSGPVCTVPVDGSDSPACVGIGTAQGITEAPNLDRFFVANWGLVLPGERRGGRIYAIDRKRPIQVLAEQEVNALTGEVYYDPVD